MNGPSKKWLRVRRATLDRAERMIVNPLEPLFTIYALVCAFYVVGSFQIRFFEHAPGFTWIEAIHILAVATAGILVPVLTGSILTLHFTSRRLERLMDEQP